MRIRCLLAAGLVLAMATSALAGPNIKQFVPFSNISAASAAVKTTSVYNVSGFANKTLQVNGVTLGSTVANPTFKNMSGTLIAQCSQTTNGPWVTCAQAQSSGGAAVSATSNTILTWRDFSNYVRLQWTSGTVGGKLKAWLNLSE